MRRLYADLSGRGKINAPSLDCDGVRLLVQVIQTVAPKGSMLSSMNHVYSEEVRVPGDVVKVASAIHIVTKGQIEVFSTVGRTASWLSYQFTNGSGDKRATLQIGFDWNPPPVRVKVMLSGDREAMQLCIVDSKWFITNSRGEPLESVPPVRLAEALHRTAEIG